ANFSPASLNAAPGRPHQIHRPALSAVSHIMVERARDKDQRAPKVRACDSRATLAHEEPQGFAA
ncbi:unnamed protein product, partial [Amoebophrya sp. A120]